MSCQPVVQSHKLFHRKRRFFFFSSSSSTSSSTSFSPSSTFPLLFFSLTNIKLVHQIQCFWKINICNVSCFLQIAKSLTNSHGLRMWSIFDLFKRKKERQFSLRQTQAAGQKIVKGNTEILLLRKGCIYLCCLVFHEGALTHSAPFPKSVGGEMNHMIDSKIILK